LRVGIGALVSFDGFGSGAMLLSNGQLAPMIPVPEPSVVVDALLMIAGIFWRERRRLAALRLVFRV
jgi:hypothetical protein